MDKNEQKPQQINITLKGGSIKGEHLQDDDLDFVNDSRSALLAKATPLSHVVITFIFLFFSVAFLWSKVADLDEVTRGVGKVVPSSKVQVIQNLEGGILSKIYVKEGEQVKKGQILAKLDDTLFKSQYQNSYSQYETLLANIACLKAQTQFKEHINFPPEVKDNQQLVNQENELFKSKRTYYNNTLKNMEHSYKLAMRELNITAPLVKKGVMSKIELIRIQREVNSIQTNMDAFKDNFLKNELSELNDKQAERDALIENLAALKDRMQRTAMRSPVDGIIKQIYINTVGGIVEPARPIMEIVPLNDKLVIEAQIKPSDIAFIEKDQPAMVKISAYDYSIYGGLKAKVTNVSADTSIDSKGNSYYEVTLKTDKSYLGSKEGSLPIMPGMTAVVDIITGKKTVLNYLLKPVLKVKEKAMREK